MDEPRFGRMWRRRAFGLRRSASRTAFDRGDPKGIGILALFEAISALAARIGLRLRARRARIRLVHPEQEAAPQPVDPSATQGVRLDARGLQRMLETEFLFRRQPGSSADDQAEQERVRRSG